jgi:broad specificity phosphatase PhoE
MPPRKIPGLHEIDFLGWTGDQARSLRAEYPGWDIWFVAGHLSPGTWCARPKGAPVAVINRDDIVSFRAALEDIVNPLSAEEEEAEEKARQALVTRLSVIKRDRKSQS